MTRKERRERDHFRLFRELSGLLPRGTTGSGRPPAADISFATKGRRLGVEIAELYAGGRHQKAKEAEEAAILQEAGRIYKRLHGPGVAIGVTFSPGPLPRRLRPQISASLAAFTLSHLPSQGTAGPIDQETHPECTWPPHIERVFMERVVRYDKAAWFSQHSAFVGPLDPGLVQGELQDKEAKLAGYRASADEVWLLLVIPEDSPSSWTVVEEVNFESFYSHFDRAFLLQRLARRFFELPLTQTPFS